MRDAARTVCRWLAALFLVGVVVQFFLAGLGVFRTHHEAASARATFTKTAFDHGFGPHIALGDVLVIISIAFVAAAVVARTGRRALLTALAVLLLVIIQAAIADAGPPAVRALHPVVGLGVLGGAGYAVYIVGVPRLWHGRGGT